MEKSVEVGGLRIGIIYENDQVIVINKPPGIAMHSKNRQDKSISIRGIFEDKLPDHDELRGGIVHRLDKDTSGVVIMAKNNTACDFLQKQFAERKVDKTYYGLVWGHLKHEKARIELPLRKSYKAPNIMSVHPAGKMSVSEYQVLANYRDYSFLEIAIHTGRTHQIRVQLAHMGHPVVGDLVYSNKKIPSGLTRQFLHAHKLAIVLPGDSKKTTFEAELAEDLKKFMDQLK